MVTVKNNMDMDNYPFLAKTGLNSDVVTEKEKKDRNTYYTYYTTVILTVATTFLFPGILVGKIIFSLCIAKFFIVFAFDGFYVYSAELFPTVIRYDFYLPSLIGACTALLISFNFPPRIFFRMNVVLPRAQGLLRFQNGGRQGKTLDNID